MFENTVTHQPFVQFQRLMSHFEALCDLFHLNDQNFKGGGMTILHIGCLTGSYDVILQNIKV